MKKRWICFSLVCLMFLTALTLTATAGESTPTDDEHQTDYASLYVQDGLTYLFLADDLTAGTTVKSLTSKVGTASITKTAGGREYYDYYRSGALSMSVTDDGRAVSSTGNNMLILNEVIPNTDGILTDMTLEISQYYLTSATAGWDGSVMLFGPLSSTGSRYSFNGGIGYSKAKNSSVPPYDDTTGRGPVKQWNAAPFNAYDKISAGEDAYVEFANNEAGVPFTTTMIYDYADAALDGVYALDFSLGRDGDVIGNHSASYDPTVDYTPTMIYAKFDGNYKAGTSADTFTDDTVTANCIAAPVASDGETLLPADDLTIKRSNFTDAEKALGCGQKAYLGTYKSGTAKAGETVLITAFKYLVPDTTETGTVTYQTSESGESATYHELSFADITSVQKWGFSYGVSVKTAYSSIRVYNRALSEAELAQNHFVDLAFAYEADLTAYAALDDSAKAKIHGAFVSKDAGSYTAAEFEEALVLLLATDGNYPAEGFDQALSFEGFQMRLYGTPALRTRFTVDMTEVSKIDGFSIKELGVLTAKADDTADFDTLSLTRGEDGSYMVGEEIRRDIVYGGEANQLRDGVFGSVTEADQQTEVYIDEYISRAYMIVAYKKGSEETATFVYYCNAEGEEDGLGHSVSLFEMANALIGTHPESPSVVRVYVSQGLDQELTLRKLEEALEGAKAHYDAVNARYDAWLDTVGTYKTDMVAYQKAALHASQQADLTSAKNDAKTLKTAADTAYGEYTAYLSSERASDLETARGFYEDICLSCTTLQFIANSTNDTSLAKTVEDALASGESYYQGLSRALLAKELTLSRAKTKIDSAYSTLSSYVLDTDVKARMYVLGDSTVCPRTSTSKIQGWVDSFLPYTTEELETVNWAVGGWSFKGMMYTTKDSEYLPANFTDIENSRFGKVLDVVGEGDFVVFGSTSPNDLWQNGKDFFYKTDEFGNVTVAVRVSKTEHYFIDENGTRVDLTEDNCAQYGYTMYTWKATPNEYYHMLKDCIDQTLAKGATPVLVTSCGGLSNTSATTRSFTITRDGVTTNYKAPIAIPGKITSSVEAYEEVKRILTAEYEGRVILIDHTPLVFAEYEKFFDEAVLEANQIKAEKGQIDYVDEYVQKTDITAQQYARYKLLSVYNADTSDPTHQGPLGAALVAEKILEILRDPDFDCDLKNYLIAEE